jgi:hypothetical protein
MAGLRNPNQFQRAMARIPACRKISAGDLTNLEDTTIIQSDLHECR